MTSWRDLSLRQSHLPFSPPRFALSQPRTATIRYHGVCASRPPAKRTSPLGESSKSCLNRRSLQQRFRLLPKRSDNCRMSSSSPNSCTFQLPRMARNPPRQRQQLAPQPHPPQRGPLALAAVLAPQTTPLLVRPAQYIHRHSQRPGQRSHRRVCGERHNWAWRRWFCERGYGLQFPDLCKVRVDRKAYPLYFQ